MSKNFCADTKISQKCGSAPHWWKPAKWLITAEVVVYDRSTCWLRPVNMQVVAGQHTGCDCQQAVYDYQ